MALSQLFLRSITRYLKNDSHKVIFLDKHNLEISKNDLFVWTYIHGKGSFKKAIELGNLRWIKHLYYYDYKYYFNAMNYAAYHGHLEVVQFLHENRTEGCTTKAMNWAAKYGHLEIVQWLHENRTEGCTTFAMNWASTYGHLEVVQFLHENRTEGCTEWAMNWAAKYGHLKVVQWLHENRTEGSTKNPMEWAVEYGQT